LIALAARQAVPPFGSRIRVIYRRGSHRLGCHSPAGSRRSSLGPRLSKPSASSYSAFRFQVSSLLPPITYPQYPPASRDPSAFSL